MMIQDSKVQGEDLYVPGEIEAFIVHIWREEVDTHGKVKTWRGSIDYVGHERRLYFDDLNAAMRFIQEQAELPSVPGFLWRRLLSGEKRA